MISLVNFGEKDPIVEFSESLKKQTYTVDNFKLAKKLEPKMRVFAPVVVRGEEDKGVRLWELGKQIYLELCAIAEDEDVGDYTDPIQGRDITIETTDAATNGTSFNQSKVRVRTKITPLSENADQVKTWLNTQPEVLTLFKKYSYEDMKGSLLEWLNPGESEDETPAPQPVAEAPKSNYSLETKAKADPAKTFDDLFSDDFPF